MKMSFGAIVAFFAVILAGCATSVGEGSSALREQSVRYGVVTDVVIVKLDGDHQVGAGPVVGAAAAELVGDGIESRELDRHAGQQFVVRLDDGESIAVTQPAGAGVYVGDHVRVEGDGHKARVARS